MKKDHMQSTMDSLPEGVGMAVVIAEALNSVNVSKQEGCCTEGHFSSARVS